MKFKPLCEWVFIKSDRGPETGNYKAGLSWYPTS